MAKKKELSEYQEGLIEYFKSLKESPEFIVTVQSVAISGMSANLKVGFVYKGSFCTINHLVHAVLGWPKVGDSKVKAIRVSGCGMDRGFHLMYSFLRALDIKWAQNPRIIYF